MPPRRRKLTPRENLCEVLRHGEPQWVPVCGHCDPYNQPNKRGMHADLAAQLADVKWRDESTVAFSRWLGLDITDWYGAPIKSRQRKVAVESVKSGNEQTTVWRTPKGELRQVQRYSPDTRMWYTAEHMVKGVDDLPAFTAMYGDLEYCVEEGGAERVEQRRKLIGEDGLMMFSMSGTPLGQMVRSHAGPEALAYLWADGRGRLRELFGVMEEQHRRYLDMALGFKPDVVVTVDDTSTTTVSPAMFEEFCLGYTDRMADATHAGGAFYFHHSCGLIRDLLPLYRQTRMDAVHAFTPPPIGNVTIAEGRAALGSKITIFAGVSQMSQSMTDRAAVARSIADMFREAAPGDHFILGLAADPEKTMEETEFVRAECRKHQQIPILG